MFFIEMECEKCHSYYSGRYCKICGIAPEKKKTTPIAKRSTKRAKQEREYSEKRKEYLKAKPICEVYNCNNASTDIHHPGGRIGTKLNDINNFLAVCRVCHNYIELNPAWAKEHGYSESRLT